MQKEIRDRLQVLLQQGYKEFSQKLIPTNKNVMLGVKIPLLRKLAKEVAKGDWRTLLHAYAYSNQALYYEEIMLEGMIIACAKMDLPERLERVKGFVSRIDNWAVCDIFCGDSKWVTQYPDKAWEFIFGYLKSEQVFEVRFGVIMMLSHFLNKTYIVRVLMALDEISFVQKEHNRTESYYVEMAVAWCLATAAAKHREETFEYFEHTSLSGAVLKKTAQKMRDSYRISREDKERITHLVTTKITNF